MCVSISVRVCNISVHACLALGQSCVAGSVPELLDSLPEMRADGVPGPPPCPCPPVSDILGQLLISPSLSSRHSCPRVPCTLPSHTCSWRRSEHHWLKPSLGSQSASPPSGNIASPPGSLGLQPGLQPLTAIPKPYFEVIKRTKERKSENKYALKVWVSHE